MQLAFTPIPLMPITMRCPIVKHQFPGAASAPPLALELAPLLAFINFGLVGKISIEFDGEIEFAGSLREVGDVNVFMQPKAYCSRNAKFDGLFRDWLHGAAAGIFRPFQAGRNNAVVAQP